MTIRVEDRVLVWVMKYVRVVGVRNAHLDRSTTGFGTRLGILA
jgi:hypothetical protein